MVTSSLAFLHFMALTSLTRHCQEPRHCDTFIVSFLSRMRIPAPTTQPKAQQEEDEIRGMEGGGDPPIHMEDDLHIPPLQIEYPPFLDAPHVGSISSTHVPSNRRCLPSPSLLILSILDIIHPFRSITTLCHRATLFL